jgi:hypothetical protein
MVEDKAAENVERLAGVNEAAGVVRKEAGGVVFVFQGDFTNKRERPGDLENSVGFPFGLNAFVSFPSDLSSWAIE